MNQLHVFEDRRARVNEVLAFAGCSVREDGKFWKSVAARTLDEAAQMAERITGELRRRNVHPMLMQFCERELLQKDLFHGVHEGTKSLFERIRQTTGEYADGTDLIDTCFADRNGLPIIAINNYETETEKSEHRGFANLLRGVFGTWRNPTAHSLRLGSELAEQDVLDALTTLSYLHRRLDSAVNTNNGRSL